MDRIAIITDIHGCLVSLETVIRDIEERGIDKIFCLGDLVAKGSQPKEALELVREKCEVVIKGNCDEIVGEKGTTLEHFWNKEKIGKENMAYLASLPLVHDFYMSGQKIRLMHASPSDMYNTINLYNIDNNLTDEMLSLFNDSDVDIVIFGHVHRIFMHRIGSKSVVAVGSISNGCDILKKEDEEVQYASYMILEGKYNEEKEILPISFEFIKLPYDYEREIKNLDESDMPNKDMAIKELKSGKYVAR